ncbi:MULTISPECIES: SDR family NAD(P)-dependent oxidoreductase [unclassified Chelatococcus]|nr:MULTISPECIES: SDR family NAD(P)-dependent oxidoreductase [unclassified Chelatococcus]MBS7743682.1 SDR family NAD(P)-dependent oxidoreductase [Chelatococcus sp. HY11]MBX3546415.1 SDR family NAD(P)-dependent oxidoreductase [Chelatococcus sp.]MCO5079745.1 SDR family NAD(P)-dependent oxidoreductase [Chelatococcus sp.]
MTTARIIASSILAAGDVLTAAVRKPESMSDLTERYGERLVVEKLDVTVTGDIAPVVARAQARRPVDIVVNNAGGGVIGATEEMSDADIEEQIALNLMAPVHITRAFIPAMRERRSGRIIQISSASGQGSLPTSSMYHAAKWGLEGFSECLRQELEPFDVFVTLIEPGGVRSSFGGNLKFASAIAAYRDTPAGAMRSLFESAGDELYTLDPQKIAQAIFEIATSERPPVRVTLGGDAYEVVQNAWQSRLAFLQSQEQLARSVAFDD